MSKSFYHSCETLAGSKTLTLVQQNSIQITSMTAIIKRIVLNHFIEALLKIFLMIKKIKFLKPGK